MTRGAALMVQGTTSSAGKSFLVAGLCRMFAQEGYRVAPFKAQNMSNNAAVTIDGSEIGRAQAVQAQACRVLPHVDMNPVLLKPEADRRSQVIVMGRPWGTLHAAAYHETREAIWPQVTAALDRLREQYDVVVIEGAGSPAEINLKARDISNMRVALHANAPVLIAGDIDRGGVFAHFYGTYHLLEPEEQRLVRGFIVNRLRGDPALLEPALTDMKRLTGVPVAGVVPWVRDHRIPEEDSVALDSRRDEAGPTANIDVAVIRFPRIANFDDFDPLEAEPDVRVRYVESPADFGEPDLVILPGTKATRADVQWMRDEELDHCVAQARTNGAAIIGICGGYQVLGDDISDPDGVEGAPGNAAGLGMLPVSTRFGGGKTTRQSRVIVQGERGLLEGLQGLELPGYEIHAGDTEAVEGSVAMVLEDGSPVGAASPDGLVLGCYLHGAFASHELRRGLLRAVARLRGKHYKPGPEHEADAGFDALADVLRSSLDLPLLYKLLPEQGH